jgi:hypothetical protein
MKWAENWKIKPPLSSERLAQVWRINGIFGDTRFYAAIGEDPNQIREVYESWYGRPSKKFPLFAAALPARFLALSLDPGIVGRIDEFLILAKEFLKSHPNSTILELRDAFSKKLGSKTYYRALALTAKGAEKVLKNGMQPRLLSYANYKPEIYDYAVPQDLPKTRLEKELREWAVFMHQGPKNDMLKRIEEGGGDRFSQSITEYPEVAAYAAKEFGKPGQTVYVFELNIPILEVTEAARVTDRMGHEPFNSLGKTFYFDQPGVENFVIGAILPQWIKGSQEFGSSNKNSKFNGD